MDYLDEYGFSRPYIINDEYILWNGKPEKGNILSGSDVAMIMFSVLWLSFTLFWEMMAIKSGSIFAICWGIPFVAIGLYLLFGRFIQKIYLRNKTFYVVTNKKIIIKSGKRIKLYDGKDLPPMDVIIHRNGNGTILFSEDMYTRRGRSHHIYFALENITDVAQVQNAINSMEK